MNLLITPAIRLSEEEKNELSQNHRLFFLKDERIPIAEQDLEFEADEMEGIICNFFFQHNACGSLKNLRFIQLTSAGLDRVPLVEIRKRGISLYNAGGTYAIPMAEWAVGKALEICKCSNIFYEQKKMCKWEKQRNVQELFGTKAVIVGFGHVGRNIALRLRGFGVHIRAVDVMRDQWGISDEWYAPEELGKAVLNTDFVFLTLPLTENTRHIIDDTILSLLGEKTVLINVARGALIDEKALCKHLDSGRLLGVALDVFEEEPLPEDSAFWKYERVVITPHNSFIGNGNQKRLFEEICRNLQNFEAVYGTG